MIKTIENCLELEKDNLATMIQLLFDTLSHLILC